MQEREKYKKGLKAYRNGFGIGLLIGGGLCLLMGRVLLILPIVLGLFIGAVFFESKLNKDG